MGRIRTIKPESFESLSQKKLSLGARLTFYGLLTMANDFGKLSYSLLKIRAHIFTFDENFSESDVEKWVGELERHDIIRRYEVDGVKYLIFPKWAAHQVVHHASKDSLPSPESLPKVSRKSPESLPKVSRKTLLGTGNREQGTGNREDARPQRASKPKTFAPEKFTPSVQSLLWVRDKFPQASDGWLEHETLKFTEYHGARGSKFSDWNRAWKNWVLKAIDFNPPKLETLVPSYEFPDQPIDWDEVRRNLK
jgi:hypothetical protein